MKKIPDKFDKMVSKLLNINKNNLYSDFCFPVIWAETNASEFYKKLLYSGVVKYSKRRVIQRLIKNIVKIFYFKLSNLFSNESLIKGEIKKYSEILIVNWYRSKDFFKKDPYLGTLYKELEENKKKFQILFFPVEKREISKLLEIEKVLIYNKNSNFFPSIFSIFADLFKNINFFKKYKLSFLEKMMFINSSIDTRMFKCINLQRYLENKFKCSNLKKILIVWENQPEQKAICLAAHNAGIKVYGYIHASLWPDQIYYARLKSQDYNKALPDKLFLHGKAYMSILEEFGWDKEDLILIKSQRYANLNKPEYFYGKLFLPYDIEESLFAIKEAKKAIKKNMFKIQEIDFHPTFSVNSSIIDLSDFPFNKSKDILVSGTRTAALEALSNKLEIFNIAKNPEIQMAQLSGFKGVEIKKIDKHIFKARFVGNPENKFFIFKGRKMIDYL